MKSIAIVLAFGALALIATTAVDVLNAWGPMVVLCMFAALMAVWAIDDQSTEPQRGASLKKAA